MDTQSSKHSYSLVLLTALLLFVRRRGYSGGGIIVCENAVVDICASLVLGLRVLLRRGKCSRFLSFLALFLSFLFPNRNIALPRE